MPRRTRGSTPISTTQSRLLKPSLARKARRTSPPRRRSRLRSRSRRRVRKVLRPCWRRSPARLSPAHRLRRRLPQPRPVPHRSPRRPLCNPLFRVRPLTSASSLSTARTPPTPGSRTSRGCLNPLSGRTCGQPLTSRPSRAGRWTRGVRPTTRRASPRVRVGARAPLGNSRGFCSRRSATGRARGGSASGPRLP